MGDSIDQKTFAQKGGGLKMKKKWKTFWTVCGTGMIVGLILIIVAIAIGFNFRDTVGYYTYDWTRWSIYGSGYNDDFFIEAAGEFEDVKNLDIDFLSGVVEFIEYDGDTIKIEKKSSHLKSNLQCYMKDDTLYIENHKTKRWWNRQWEGILYVYIPQDTQFDMVDISLGAGRLSADRIVTETLDIKSGAGQIQIDSYEAVHLEATCGAGQINMAGLILDSAAVNCGVGQINMILTALEEDYNYEVSYGIGSITIGGEALSGLGGRKVIDNNQKEKIELRCGTGEIRIEFEEGDDSL